MASQRYLRQPADCLAHEHPHLPVFSFFGYCLGVGFTAALLIFWSVRSRLSLTRIPKIFRGFPITFLCLILSLALFGLLNQLPA